MEPKCGAWRQNGGRPGDVTEAGRPVLRGLEVILQILRFGDHFCGDHGAAAPPPSLFKGTVVNWAMSSLYGGSLKIMLTVPLKGLLRKNERGE